MNVLLVEDNLETAAFIIQGLRRAGDDIEHAEDVQTGLQLARATPFDILVFDRMLPGMDGLDMVRILRTEGIDTPIIMLTALGGIDDRVNGLNAGADDYMTKPFAFSELYARLNAHFRRHKRDAKTSLSIGDLVLDRTTQTVSRNGQSIDLLPREYKILEYLMQHEGQVVTRSMLLEHVWGFKFDPKTSLVQTHVSRLRARLDKPFDKELIKTQRGEGYVISADH